MRILLVSGYHGGSHQAWAEGYRQYSAHEVELLTLPARFWKWRMHGGAVTLARRFMEYLKSGRLAMPDLLIFTDMVDVTTFLALVRGVCPDVPAVLYMHENQLTYPLPEDPDSGPMRRQKGERDLHYAFINYASMLAADRIYFNSEYHHQEFLGALPVYLRHFPELNELPTVQELREKSVVLPPAINASYLESRRPEKSTHEPPLVIWNQRWEFDKGPASFFDALRELDSQGLDFQLAVCGERFARQPVEFLEARTLFQGRIVHWGFAEKDAYARLLWRSTITASTAVHEFFGISILEALYCETYAALPRRLSYPELLPASLYESCSYDGHDQLVERLGWAIRNPGLAREVSQRLSRAAAAFDWRLVAARYDAEFEGFV